MYPAYPRREYALLVRALRHLLMTCIYDVQEGCINPQGDFLLTRNQPATAGHSTYLDPLPVRAQILDLRRGHAAPHAVVEIVRVHGGVPPVEAHDDGRQVAPRGQVGGVLQEPDLVGVALPARVGGSGRLMNERIFLIIRGALSLSALL